MNILKQFNWKYRYLKRKLYAVKCTIIDMEFKRFKTLEIREQIRTEYDTLRSKLEILQTKIKSEEDKPSISTEELARLKDTEVLYAKDVDQLVNQMKHLDVEVYGEKPSQENPAGTQGYNDQLDALQELVSMLNHYAKTI